MNKREFLKKLEAYLNGEVPYQVISDQLNYYSDYISGEVEKGRKEEEVIEELGDARLIAKTIEEACSAAAENGTTGPSGYVAYEPESSYDYSGGQTEGTEQDYDTRKRFHVYNLNQWWVKALGLLIIVGIFWLIAVVIGGIFTILSPILLPCLLILIIYWAIKGIMKR